MQPILLALMAFVTTLLRSRLALPLEIVALRHQVAIYQRSVSRPRLHATDRLFWVWLSRLWSGWQHALVLVKLRTVIVWQKRRFRDHWRRLSQRGKPGRPAVSTEVRELIRDRWRANPTWGGTSHRWGTVQAGHCRRQIDGGEVSAQESPSVVSNVDDLSEQPCRGYRGV
jgi:putative transposase